MKNRWIVLLLLMVAVVLSACGKAPQIPDEPYAAVPYRLYPAPEGAYVGDTMPFVADGRLELYYLYDTDHNGQGYHPIYKYSTEDLTQYQDHGKVLDFGLMSDPDPALGTGSVLLGQDGQYHLFYTGHNDMNGNAGKDRECVMHAVSSDRETWTKIPEDTFCCPENYSKDDFRDPNVFWVEDEQCYWLLIAARENTQGGVVAKYTSPDLKEWTLCDPIYTPHAQYMLECPDLFRMGDKWYLTYSWDCVTYYAMSDSMYGPFQAPMDNVLDGTGFVFYAAKTAELNGNRYLCGWVGRSAIGADTGMYSWAGNMVNHQLVQHEDGTLGVREPESFASYFTVAKPFNVTKQAGKVSQKKGTVSLNGQKENAIADLGTRAATMMLECDVTFRGGVAGFAFGGTEEYGPSALCLDAQSGQVHYEGIPVEHVGEWDSVSYTKFDFTQKDTHHVKLVCENEIVIVYIDDIKALSTRIFDSIDGAHIGLFAVDTDAQFSNITMMVPEK